MDKQPCFMQHGKNIITLLKHYLIMGQMLSIFIGIQNCLVLCNMEKTCVAKALLDIMVHIYRNFCWGAGGLVFINICDLSIPVVLR